MELVPRSGRHTIVFGRIEQVERKFDKLLRFYRSGLMNIGWGVPDDRYQIQRSGGLQEIKRKYTVERKNYTVAVDLGSSNVVVAVGEKAAEGQMEVASIVSKPVEGVNAGKIENIELVSRAIREAMSEAEEQLGIRITRPMPVFRRLRALCPHMDHVFVYDPQNGVNQKDVDALFDRMRNVQAPDDETIMDRVPQNYVVDDNQEVKNPVGSFGKKLLFHVQLHPLSQDRCSGSTWPSNGWESRC
ncbi:MAG: hypothetical protein ACLRMJ_02460 [Alistipes finegoldii]